MKVLQVRLSFITILIGLFSFGFTPQIDRNLEIGSAVKRTDSLEVKYNRLPPLVKEFLHKGYGVKSEDVRKIIKIQEGSFLVKMYRSVNVFSINTKLKMQHEKLDFVAIEKDFRMQRKKKIQNIKYVGSRNINRSSKEQEIAWSSIPLNVREYLTKRMEASESQVYKVFDLRNDSYKIILKAAYDEFVILEESPNKIAFEHPDTDGLD